MKTKEKVLAINITTEQRNIIGCKAVSGTSVIEISDEHQTNREFVYSQKKRISMIIEKNSILAKETVVIIDESMKEKIIVACMLICKASTEDTQRFISTVFNEWISIGKISRIINEAATKAEHWNSSIDLRGIKTGANDEIFQGSTPILVGVDPNSTFTYMMEEAENRDSTTWGYHLLEKEKTQGLHLDMTVNDGGSGLRKGIKEAFPNITEQLDIFHTQYDLSKAVRAMERDACKAIDTEEKLEKKLLSSKSRLPQDVWEKHDKAAEKTSKSVRNFDNLKVLYSWILELLSIGGYFYYERVDLLNFIILEMEKLDVKNTYFLKSLKFIKGNLHDILYFVKKAEIQMQEFEAKENIPEDVLRKMWKQLRYSSTSAKYNYLEAEIGVLLGNRYDEIREKWDCFITKIVRASSIVECINSLIRPYINLKKSVPAKFFSLIQFYFNTRKYRRSDRRERVGKSPIELLTGKEYADPLTLLGY
jgi:hypothetical protein